MPLWGANAARLGSALKALLVVACANGSMGCLQEILGVLQGVSDPFGLLVLLVCLLAYLFAMLMLVHNDCCCRY